MKKVLLFLLVPCFLIATQNTLTGGKWSAGSILSTDTVTASGVGIDSIDGSQGFLGYLRPSTNTKAQAKTATSTFTVANFWYDSGTTGAKAYPDSIVITGTNASMKISSLSGTITATSTVLHWVGATGTLNKNKASVFKILRLANSTSLIYTGSSFEISNTGPPLIMGDNAGLTANGSMVFYNKASNNFFTLGTNNTINGSGLFSFRVVTSNINPTIPALAYTGSGSIVICADAVVTNDSIKITGTQNYGTAGVLLFLNTAGAVLVVQNVNNNITCGAIAIGNNTASGSFTYLAGSGSHSIASYAATYNGAGTTGINFQTSPWSCTGSWTFGSNHTITPGTSIITSTGTGTWTSNGKSFYDWTRNDVNTGYATLGDSMTAHDVTITDGKFNQATYGLRCNDLTINAADTCKLERCWLTGDYSSGASAIIDTNGMVIYLLAGSSHTMTTNNKAVPAVTVSGPTTIADNSTIKALSYGIDGVSLTVTAAKKLTVTMLTIGGAVDALDTLRSGTVGVKCTLDLAGTQTITLQYAALGDVYLADGDTIIVSDGTSIDLGGNSGNIVYPSSSSSTRRRHWGWLGLGVWITP
jgi:hypothetical protein